MIKTTVYIAFALGGTALQEPIPGDTARHWAKQELVNRDLERSRSRRVDPNEPVDWLNQASARPRSAPNRPMPTPPWAEAERRDGGMQRSSRLPLMGMAFDAMGAVPPGRGPFSGPFVGPGPPGPGPYGGTMRPPWPPPVTPPWGRGWPASSPHTAPGWTPAYNPDDQQRAKVKDSPLALNAAFSLSPPVSLLSPLAGLVLSLRMVFVGCTLRP